MNEFYILEDTCRDSLYVSNFLIETEVILRFAEKISRLGFEYIEIGHPLGLGAYRKYSSSFTDEQMLTALQKVIINNKVFCFFIPGTGILEDIQIAKEYGLYGVRVGINASELRNKIKEIESIKNKGMFTCLNLMKSYDVTPKEFAKNLKDIKDLVDVVYLVDSAGCMFQEDLKEYFTSIREEMGDIKLGFHGHNNLSLVTANALVAIECGVNMVDTTLGGIGRSSGNLATEVLLSIMLRKGILHDENILLETLRVTRDFRNYLESKGIRYSIKEEDTLFGFAAFHSSYEGMVKEFSEREGVDFNKMIIEVSRISKTNVDNETMRQALMRIQEY